MIRKVTYNEYYKTATMFLKQHGFDLKDDLPTDVELLCDTAGINLIPIPNIYHDFGVRGAVVRRIDGYDIALDQTHWFEHEAYVPFTIAEELGHILLHSYLYADVRNISDSFNVMNSLSDYDYRKMENQAKNVGSFILLPRERFKKYTLRTVTELEAKFREKLFVNKEDLAEEIAEIMSHNLKLSKKVLELVITTRYPEPLLIDEVLTHFGIDLLS